MLITYITNVLYCCDGSTVETYSDGTEVKLSPEDNARALEADSFEFLCHLIGRIPPGKSDSVQ